MRSRKTRRWPERTLTRPRLGGSKRQKPAVKNDEDPRSMPSFSSSNMNESGLGLPPSFGSSDASASSLDGITEPASVQEMDAIAAGTEMTSGRSGVSAHDQDRSDWESHASTQA